MDVTNGRQRMMSFGPAFSNLALFDRRIVVQIAPAAGVAVAALVALAFLVMPIVVLEDMAMDSGIAAFLTAAAPPFGFTARLAITFFAALAAGGMTWFGLFLIVGGRTAVLNRGKRDDGVPVLRRADAHPDAPPRRPVFANSDLGTPFLDVKAEPVPVPEARDLPADLDTPLSTYLSPFEAPLPAPDPMPLVLAPEPEPQPARFAPHERIETFELTPMVRDAAAEPSAPLPPATIHDLLERLERGVKRAPEPAAEPQGERSLEDTLDALRALARRVG
jgi:hypothetical protein